MKFCRVPRALDLASLRACEKRTRHQTNIETPTRKVCGTRTKASRSVDPGILAFGTAVFACLERFQKLIRMGFGPHLVLDGYGGAYNRLTDLSLIYRFLDECPERIGMTKIMPPYVFRYTGVNPKDWGVSGFVLIAESHISVHTFPEKRYLSLDIFSCKEFDAEEVISFAREYFLLEHYEHHVLQRGQEFPHDVIRSARIVESERAHFEETRLRSAL